MTKLSGCFSVAALLVLAALFAASVCGAVEAAPDRYIKYSVSDGSAVTVVSAVTPYDAEPRAKDAFLMWFQRGFETVLAGRQPLMIEWMDSPAGRAGRQGYDFGMDGAKRHLKEKRTGGPYTVPIPSAGF